MASETMNWNAHPTLPMSGPVSQPAPAPEHQNEAAIAQDVIAAMRVRRPDLLARLLRAYLKHTPGAVEELRNQLARLDIAGLRFSAHTIKLSSANVGARRLQALCGSLEALAVAPDAAISACAPLAIAIEQEFDLVRVALERELDAPRGLTVDG